MWGLKASVGQKNEGRVFSVNGFKTYVVVAAGAGAGAGAGAAAAAAAAGGAAAGAGAAAAAGAAADAGARFLSIKAWGSKAMKWRSCCLMKPFSLSALRFCDRHCQKELRLYHVALGGAEK